ncbi:unnamed protein product, partial [Durusdinium trenchii]
MSVGGTREPLGAWKPRDRALGLDPFRDLDTARKPPHAHEVGDEYVRNEEFEEVPLDTLGPHDWSVQLNGSWKHLQEHITLKEGRALTLAIRRLSRNSRHRGKRLLIFVDIVALAFSVGKGRSCNHAMLRVNQKIGALALACGLILRVRWIPSEFNVSDGPSRGSKLAGWFKAGYLRALRGSLEKKVVKRVEPVRMIKAMKKEVKFVVGVKNTPFGDEGKRAQKGKLTMLEVNSISGVQEAQYQHYLRCFKDFCKESKIGFPKDNKLDAVLADYFDVLFLDGKTAAEGEKTLASLEFFNHKMKGKLTRSRKALKGWRRLRPPKSRLPLPKPAVWGIAMRLLFKGAREMALTTLLSFDVYLRPGETADLKVKNLVRPVGNAGVQYKHYTVVIKDEDDQIPDKTGVFSNSVKLDNPLTASWLGPALQQMVRKRKQDDPLFSFEQDKYRKRFQEAGSWLGLPNLHLYQLRHGGASDDLCQRIRDHNAVKDRGRWLTDTSVRRYAKSGKVQEMLNKMPAWALHAKPAVDKMGAVVRGHM